MIKKKWAAALLISVFAAGLALTGCGGNDAGESGPSGKVTVSGSSALLPLAKDAAQKFKAKNDQVSITLNAGGSGTGLKQVSEGSVDIGNSDVFAKEKLPEAKAAELVDHKVAVTVMAPVVSKEIGTNVKSLTKAQLQDIFTGKVTNWKDVGGPDEAVVLITRPSTSGTRALFTKYALDGKEELSNKSMETDDSGTLVQTVSQTKGAIGYVALSYLMNNNTVTPLAIDGVEPTLDDVYNGKYPVWGYEHMYTKGEATGAVKAFIDFIMSKDYSADIEKQGYGVASKMKVTRE
ncbi:MAG: phosphate ABC transporter substrate-binding protein [Allisonella histaminiformans]|uniref:phosphate ABC transporter substrate-binding protein n=1 Tax=Allisonella histaminiformans TaxID=209880 RepID=UPI002A7F7635|nr:phosphate ABC transporter substrate-binding protein [Allisonella histaminiformans]MDY3956959.1 phosphate ABC transporter substrate-binding protein [Allisonella histaminiformans]